MLLLVDRHAADRAASARAVADFVAINYVAGAPAGHAKNISALLLPGEVSIAPLFDLATGLAYDARQEERQVAISIGGERRLGSVGRRRRDKAAAILDLPAPDLHRRVGAMSEGFADAFGAELERIGTPTASKVRSRTLPASWPTPRGPSLTCGLAERARRRTRAEAAAQPGPVALISGCGSGGGRRPWLGGRRGWPGGRCRR